MGETARLFVGLMLPAAVSAHLDEAVAPLRTRAAADAGARWVAPERWHITLAFLGGVDRARIPALSTALGHAVHAASAPDALRLRGSGQFDRTLWVGVDAAPSTVALARATQAAMRDAGIGVERRPWRPHVTVARARQSSAALDAPQAALTGYAGPSWHPSTVALVESITGPQPMYVVRHEVPLGQ